MDDQFSESRCWREGDTTRCRTWDTRSDYRRAWDGCGKGRKLARWGVPIVDEVTDISDPTKMGIKGLACAAGAAYELRQEREKSIVYL